MTLYIINWLYQGDSFNQFMHINRNNISSEVLKKKKKVCVWNKSGIYMNTHALDLKIKFNCPQGLWTDSL